MNHTSHRDTAFLNRFRSVWARKRRVELGQVAVSSLLLALLALGGLAIADYSLELDRSMRVIALSVSLGDLADRLEITAQRLDGAYRAIIAPQAEELRKLEQALADLREKLENLET